MNKSLLLNYFLLALPRKKAFENSCLHCMALQDICAAIKVADEEKNIKRLNFFSRNSSTFHSLRNTSPAATQETFKVIHCTIISQFIYLKKPIKFKPNYFLKIPLQTSSTLYYSGMCVSCKTAVLLFSSSCVFLMHIYIMHTMAASVIIYLSFIFFF